MMTSAVSEDIFQMRPASHWNPLEGSNFPVRLLEIEQFWTPTYITYTEVGVNMCLPKFDSIRILVTIDKWKMLHVQNSQYSQYTCFEDNLPETNIAA